MVCHIGHELIFIEHQLNTVCGALFGVERVNLREGFLSEETKTRKGKPSTSCLWEGMAAGYSLKNRNWALSAESAHMSRQSWNRKMACPCLGNGWGGGYTRDVAGRV